MGEVGARRAPGAARPRRPLPARLGGRARRDDHGRRRGSRCSRRTRPSSSSRSSSSAGRPRTRNGSSEASACALPSLTCRHKRGRLLYEPYGAVAVIAPWNFPFGIPFTQTIAAVAAGNAVIVKPSELAPLSGAWVERAFEAVGAPPGLVRVAHGDGSTGEELVRARGIAKVFFTGSTGVGSQGCARRGRAPVPGLARAGRQGRDARLRGRGSRPRARWSALGLASRTAARPAPASSGSTWRATSSAVRRGARHAAPRACGSGPAATSAPSSGRSISEQQRAKVERLVTEAVDGGASAATRRRPSRRRPPGLVLRADRADRRRRGRGADARGDLRAGRCRPAVQR